jgi:hypothetical protein
MEDPKPQEVKDVKKKNELSEEDLKTVAGGAQVVDNGGTKASEVFLKFNGTDQ